MAADYTLNADPIGNILSKIQANQAIRGEGQRQRLADVNSNLANSKASFEQEGVMQPETDANGNFTGRFVPHVAPDVGAFAKKMLERQEGGGLNPLYGNPQEGIPSAPNTPSGRWGGYDPTAGQPQPTPQVPDVQAAKIAGAPTQAPGDPKPIFLSPKIQEKAAEKHLEATSQPAPGQVVGKLPSEQDKTTIAQPPPQEMGGLQIPTSGGQEPPLDPFLAKRAMDVGTTMSHYNFDPPIDIAANPFLRQKFKIPDNYSGPPIWTPTSIVKGAMAGEYKLGAAEISAGKNVPSEQFAPYLKMVDQGVPFADVLNKAVEDGVKLNPGAINALKFAEQNHLSKDRYALSKEALGFRISNAAQQAIIKDTNLSGYADRLQGISRMESLIHKIESGAPDAPKGNQQILAELNNEFTRLMVGKSNFAEGSAERLSMDSADARIRNVLDTISGDVTPADLSAKFGQLKSVINVMKPEYQGAMKDRLNFMGAGAPAGQGSVYNGHKAAIPSIGSGAASPGHSPEYETDRQKYLKALDDPKLVDPARRTEAYGTFDQDLRKRYGKGIRGQ